METTESKDLPSAATPTFNSTAADLNQLRNEVRKIAESAPAQLVHKSVLARAAALCESLTFDLGLPETPDALSYADLSVLLSQCK